MLSLRSFRAAFFLCAALFATPLLAAGDFLTWTHASARLVMPASLLESDLEAVLSGVDRLADRAVTVLEALPALLEGGLAEAEAARQLQESRQATLGQDEAGEEDESAMETPPLPPTQNWTAPPDTGVQPSNERVLRLVHAHTGESATIAFKRDGEFVPEGLHQINQFLRDWRQKQAVEMDPLLFDVLWTVHRDTGAQAAIIVLCGYRSPTTNEYLRATTKGVAKFSQHMSGKAIDFLIPDVPTERVHEAGLRLQAGGVGFYPHAGTGFIHLDTGPVRHWPEIARDRLVQIFPEGRTVHLPADGKPLPGYNEALAELRAKRPTALAPITMKVAVAVTMATSIGAQTGATPAKPVAPKQSSTALPFVKKAALTRVAMAPPARKPARRARPEPEAETASEPAAPTPSWKFLQHEPQSE